MTNYIPELFDGILLTIILMLSTLIIGFVLAIILTLCSLSENFFIKKITDSFVFFICGTPLLVQMFIIYFGIGQFDSLRDTIVWSTITQPLPCAIIALAINSACYISVILKGAVYSVPKNEIDACKAMAMSKWLAIRRIIFPRAFRIALPAYSNEVIMSLKATSLVSAITLLDIMGLTQQMASRSYDIIPLYLTAGFLYLLLNTVIIIAFRYLYRWSKTA